MHILKSLLVVLAAGAAIVLLAVAGKEGLEAAGLHLAGWRQFLIPAVSTLIVAHLFVWRIRRSAPERVGRPRNWALVVPTVIAVAASLTLAHTIFDPMGKAGEWPKDLSVWGFMAAMVVAWHVWEVHRAVKVSEHAE